MRLVLDSGGVTGLVGQRARLEELRRRDVWPPVLPSVVLTECLTGDHRRDFHTNGLLRACEIRDVDELLARRAAVLRGSVRTSRTPSAVDAVVVALAEELGATVLTSDPRDLRALAAGTSTPVRIVATTSR